LNSNYLKDSLKDYYQITDTNKNDRVGHEFIIDVKEFTKYGITENDIAKRIIDYNFHPPTMSWPRKNVLMFEPTESESKDELDRLIEAMINIRKEIDEIVNGEVDSNNNVLKNAPHTLNDIIDWKYPYSIKKGLYPVESLRDSKFYPPISRVNTAYGDKKLLSKI
jgi:glycine dehydrogenase